MTVSATPLPARQVINEGQYIEHVQGNAVHNTYLQRLLGTHKLTEEYVNSLLSRYTLPRDQDSISGSLNRHRIVVLVGKSGAGRMTTAICTLRLLHESDALASADGRPLSLTEVRRGLNDLFDVSGMVISEHTGYILDMRADDEAAPNSFGRSLFDLNDRLRQANSYLIVAMSESLWNRVGPGAEFLKVDLLGPTPQEVFSRHLDSHRGATYWLNDNTISDAVAKANAGGATHVATIISETERLATSSDSAVRTDEDGEALLALVHAAIRNWRKELIDWSNHPHTSESYGFLLVSAVLVGSASGMVYSLALQLAADLEGTSTSRGLSAPGVIQLAYEVKAEVSNDGLVSFTRPGYADAALNFFLANRPDLVSRFHDWLIQLPRVLGKMNDIAEQQKSEARNKAAAFLTDQIVRGKDKILFRKVIDAWSCDDSTLAAAADIITAAALSPGFGREAREETREWSANLSRTPSADGRALAVAEACRGELSRVAPAITIKRLEHLANRSDTRLEPVLASALSELYSSMDLRRVLIKETLAWVKNDPNTINGARKIYAALLASKRPDDHNTSALLTDSRSEDEDWLISAWSVLLTSAQHEQRSLEIVGLWLETAWSHQELVERLTRIFVRAVWSEESGVGSETRLARLLDAAYTWAPTDNIERHHLRSYFVAAVAQPRSMHTSWSDSAPRLQ